MLSLKDCLDFCDLDCSGIEAIAEHEHIPVIVAAELSNELLKTPEGIGCLHEMALDNLNQAMAQGDWEKRCVSNWHTSTCRRPIHSPLSSHNSLIQ